MYFAASTYHRIRKVDSSGTITTVTTGVSATPGYSGDGGQATSALYIFRVESRLIHHEDRNFLYNLFMY